MSKFTKIVRSTILALALLGFAGGAVAVTHAPSSFTLADSGRTIDGG